MATGYQKGKAKAKNIQIQGASGATIKFDKPDFYGDPDTPITGNITYDTTGLVPGSVVVVFHQDSVVPELPFDDSWRVDNIEYQVNTLNEIWLLAIAPGRINYAFRQPIQFINSAPTATGVTLTLDGIVGGNNVLRLTYTFADEDDDAEDTTATGTQYEMVRYDSSADASNDVNGTVVASGATSGSSITYSEQAGDEDKFFRGFVFPKSSAGTLGGVDKYGSNTVQITGDADAAAHIDRVNTAGGEVLQQTLLEEVITHFKSTNQWNNIKEIWSPDFGLKKDGSNRVSALYGVKSNDLTNATLAEQPLWISSAINSLSGLRADGVDDDLSGVSWTLAQPCTFYFIIKQLSWATGQWIFSGATDSRGIVQNFSTNRIDLHFGTTGQVFRDMIAGQYSILSAVVDGASSRLQIDDATIDQGNPGANDSDGFRLFSRYDGNNEANVEIAMIIVKSVADSEITISSNKNFLNDIYAIL